ncbi:MAG: hypothetical protein Q9190_000146 [Brigantiaea leucoxantha]
MQSPISKLAISPSPFQNSTSHSRWLAITHRAPSSHSSFFYGVISTKIYCRPTCSARLARRANIVYYDTIDQARRDGFRPCKRCKPDDTTFFGEGEEVVTRTVALLRTKRGDSTIKGGLKEVAKEVGVTPSYLCRIFKKTMGVTVGVYMKEFEREETSEAETESSFQSVTPSSFNAGVVDMGIERLAPVTIARSPLTSIEDRKGWPAEGNVRNVEEALGFDFDFNEWIWTEDLLNNNVYD